MRSLVVLLVLVLLIALAWTLRGDPGSSPPLAEPPQASDPIVGELLRGEIPEDEVLPDEQPPAVQSPTVPERQALPASSADGSGPAVIRGRVVDVQILPLAGVDVRLRGFERFTMDPSLRLAAEPRQPFENPEGVVTESDGEFEFVFYVPQLMTLRLNLIKGGHATRTGTWETLQPGDVVDMGDVALNPAVSVTVQVADSDGVALPGVSVTLAREEGLLDEVEGQFRQRNSFTRSTLADGSMTFREGVPAGPWMISARPGVLLRPKLVDILPTQEKQVVRLVMKSESSLPTLRGIVTDPEGEPVARAYVMPMGMFGGSVMATNADGAFTVRGPAEAAGEEVKLQIGHAQFEPSGELGPFRWGQSDLKITLHPGSSLMIGARNGGDLVTSYSWNLLSLPGQTGLFTVGGPRNGEASTPDGTVLIPRLPRGRYLLHVRVPGDSLGMRQVQEVSVADASNEVWVDLFPAASRSLRVESDGDPLEGVQVWLLEPLNGTVVDAETAMLDPQRSYHLPENVALVVQAGGTDSRGEFTMRAASTAGVGLRLSTPGFEPMVLSRVDLGREAPLVVTLHQGGRIRGLIRPLDLLRDLRLYSRDTFRARGSGLELQIDRSDAAGEWRRLSEGGSAEIAADGSFVCVALEPGDYRLSIRWLRPSGIDGVNVGLEMIQIAEIRGLRSGEDRDLGSLQLVHLRRGELRGRVWLNGEPATGEVILSPQDGGGSETARLNADGDYRIALVAGYYWASLQRAQTDRAVFGQQTVRVTAGTTQRTDLRLEPRFLKVEVRDDRNVPQPSAIVVLAHVESGRSWVLPATSEAGTLELWLVPGRYRFLREQRVLGEVVVSDLDPEPMSILWDRR